MRRAACLLWTVALLALPAGPAWGQEQPKKEDKPTAEEELLKTWGIPLDGQALLEFFRKRTPSDEQLQGIPDLVRQLGDNTFKKRDKASDDLATIGLPALPELKRALQDADPEIRRRAERCIESIEEAARAGVLAVAARLVKEKQPPGASNVLLAYLPYAGDEMVEEEIVVALVTMAEKADKEGRIDAALLPALKDPSPARRAAAALVLGRYGDAVLKEEVRNLLTDVDPKVRVRAAIGLLAGKDLAAVPALIETLGQGPIQLAWSAEDMLIAVAGKDAPNVALQDDEAARRKCQQAWKDWWQAHESKLDAAKLKVDLAILSSYGRARDAVRRGLTAFFSGDLATVQKATAVPFYGVGYVMENREEFDKTVEMLTPDIVKRKMTFTIKGAVGVREYVKTCPETEKVFLTRLRESEVRVVYVDWHEEGMATGSFAMFVKVSGGQAHIIGLSEHKDPNS